MDNDNTPRLILASASVARRSMMEAAGLTFDVVPADVDEGTIRASMMSESDCVEAGDLAAVLAVEKAMAVSALHPSCYVIGSDQVLALGRHMITKAATRSEARDTLDRLRGRSHELVSCAALVRNGEVMFHCSTTAHLTMRRFSDAFLETYLDTIGDRVLTTVGCYHLEGPGIQLFDQIDGDYFTILGLPLVPLLHQLRALGVVAT